MQLPLNTSQTKRVAMRDDSQLLKGFSRTQQGSAILLFAAVLLPIIFFVFSITIDLKLFFSEQQRIQKALDEAGLQAYRFLNTGLGSIESTSSQISNIIHTHIQNRVGASISSKTSIVTGKDYIELEYFGSFPIIFGSYYQDAISGLS